MKVKNLLKGIQEILKTHPEVAEWDVYNTFEHVRSVDFGFIPENYNTSSGPKDIPDFARVDDWYYQKWYYDMTGEEPDDSVKKQWAIEKAHTKIINWLKETYKFDQFDSYDILKGSYMMCCDNLFISPDFPNVTVRLKFETEGAVKHAKFFTDSCGLWYVCKNAIESVMGYQQTDDIKMIVGTKIAAGLEEMEERSYIESINHRNLPECFRGVTFENVPTELGGGCIAVCTFCV